MDGGDAGIDHDRLQAALATLLDGPVTDTAVVHEGLNTTVTVATETADPAYVLRKPDRLRDAALFTDREREYRILERLAAARTPGEDAGRQSIGTPGDSFSMRPRGASPGWATSSDIVCPPRGSRRWPPSVAKPGEPEPLLLLSV